MKILKFVSSLIEDIIPGVLLGLMTIIVLADVIGRYVFNHPFVGVSELALIGMVWVIFLGAVGVLRRREHIALELFVDRLGHRGQAILDTVIHLVMLTVLADLLYLSIKFVTTTYFSNLVVTGLSRRFMAVSIVIMIGLMLIIVLQRTYRAVRGIFAGEYDRGADHEAPSDGSIAHF